MLIRFTTETGSVYEIIPAEKKARRIKGTSAPTPRFRKDGEWVQYEALAFPATEIEIGDHVLFIWEHDGRPDDERLKDNTLTSAVESVETFVDDYV